jgi:hypothetical protein
MEKKKDLAAALHKTAEPTATVTQSAEKTGFYKKVPIIFRIDEAGKRELEYLRLDIGAKNMQSLMIEAVNDLLEKHGKKRIA